MLTIKVITKVGEIGKYDQIDGTNPIFVRTGVTCSTITQCVSSLKRMMKNGSNPV